MENYSYQKKVYVMKLVIVGGGAGGPTAASRARRLNEESEIVLLERGEHISYGHCGLPYYIGRVIPDRENLLISTPENFNELYNVDIRVRSEVKNIITDTKEVEVVDLETGNSYNEKYDKLILSTGASPIKPLIPGIDVEGIFTLRNLTDADKITQFIDEQKPTKAVIVGGGFIGLEMAENLRNQDMEVTVVEMLDQVLPILDREMSDLLHQTLKLHGVELALSDPVEGFERQNGQILVKLKSGREISSDMVMLSIGVKPNIELAKLADLEIGETGGIKVNEYLQTSNSDIYAVGDAVETKHMVTGEPVLIPLAGLANRQARMTADNIYGRDTKYRGSLGTSLVKVFGMTVGTTGVNEKTLKQLDIPYEKCYIAPFSHVTYYPGASQMNLKLLFSSEDGKILGSQILGNEGVDKRIDTLATAISSGMNVEDLTHLELGYVPQYGSAKEVINYAGYVSSNILNEDMPVVHWDKLDELMEGDGIFLDVRPSDVTEMGMVPDAKNIPLRELRDRLDELPKDVPIYVYCNIGIESYIATRILLQHGLDARNMNGGFGMYKCACLYEGATETTSQTDKTPDEESDSSEVASVSSQPTSVTQLDACGLQCPGPIMKVKQKIDELKQGDVLEITANDAGFAADLPAWCRSCGHEVLSVETQDGKIVGRIRKQEEVAKEEKKEESQIQSRDKTIVVFSNDFDRVMSAFIIANGAASMGHKVNLFFTFWGLNVLRKKQKVSVRKSLMERMFGWMMPKGSSKLTLSKMNMGGMGTRLMKRIMRKKNVNNLEELIDSAKEQGARLIACSMTMDIMGLKKEELIDGVEEGGVAAFLEDADQSNVTLFI